MLSRTGAAAHPTHTCCVSALCLEPQIVVPGLRSQSPIRIWLVNDLHDIHHSVRLKLAWQPATAFAVRCAMNGCLRHSHSMARICLAGRRPSTLL